MTTDGDGDLPLSLISVALERFDSNGAVIFGGLVTKEMLDPGAGLFISKDGNRTLQPNPDSATTAGADHLSYFALLGRIVGFALFHREVLNASWTPAFLKAVLGYAITFDDLRSIDPALHDSQAKLLDMSAEELASLCLTFSVDSERRTNEDEWWHVAAVFDSTACVEGLLACLDCFVQEWPCAVAQIQREVNEEIHGTSMKRSMKRSTRRSKDQ